MREIELCLNTNNDRAMELYKKVGFEEKACLQYNRVKPHSYEMYFSYEWGLFITLPPSVITGSGLI